jgi:hypothetical protein
VGWSRALPRAVAVACIVAVIAWVARAGVPPAPLFIARAVAARTVEALEPVDVVRRSVPASTVSQWGGLTAFTAIHAPGGLRQDVIHVWRRDGAVIARVSLATIRGGRAEGFRTWSYRRDLRPPSPAATRSTS